jgi:hypothetical protein
MNGLSCGLDLTSPGEGAVACVFEECIVLLDAEIVGNVGQMSDGYFLNKGSDPDRFRGNKKLFQIGLLLQY